MKSMERISHSASGGRLLPSAQQVVYSKITGRPPQIKEANEIDSTVSTQVAMQVLAGLERPQPCPMKVPSIDEIIIDHVQDKIHNVRREKASYYDVYQTIKGQELRGRVPLIHPRDEVPINPNYEALEMHERSHCWAEDHGLVTRRQLPLRMLTNMDAPLKSRLAVLKEQLIETKAGPGVEVPYLLPTNPDLLAALTAPTLDKGAFDAYRKLLAWLYCHDDLVVDNKRKGTQSERGTQTDVDLNRHRVLKEEYEKIMDGEPLNVARYDGIDGALINIFNDMWMSFQAYNCDQLKFEIKKYLGHGERELNYSLAAIMAEEGTETAPEFPYKTEDEYYRNREIGGGILVAFEGVLCVNGKTLLTHQEHLKAYAKHISMANDITSLEKELDLETPDNIVKVKKALKDQKESAVVKTITEDIANLSNVTSKEFETMSNFDRKELMNSLEPSFESLSYYKSFLYLDGNNNESDIWRQCFDESLNDIRDLTDEKPDKMIAQPTLNDWCDGYVRFEHIANRHKTAKDERTEAEKERDKWQVELDNGLLENILTRFPNGYALDLSLLLISTDGLDQVLKHIQQIGLANKIIEINLCGCQKITEILDLDPFHNLTTLRITMSGIKTLPDKLGENLQIIGREDQSSDNQFLEELLDLCNRAKIFNKGQWKKANKEIEDLSIEIEEEFIKKHENGDNDAKVKFVVDRCDIFNRLKQTLKTATIEPINKLNSSFSEPIQNNALFPLLSCLLTQLLKFGLFCNICSCFNAL